MPDLTVPEVPAALAPLHGLPMRGFVRAGNMLMVEFGELRQVHRRKGGTHLIGEWALHIQCAWRLVRPPEILVANFDFYTFADRDEPYDFDADGSSRFDQLAKPITEELATQLPEVTSIQFDHAGGLSLGVASGLFLDVFPHESTANAYDSWRLFRPGDDGEHWVFS